MGSLVTCASGRGFCPRPRADREPRPGGAALLLGRSVDGPGVRLGCRRGLTLRPSPQVKLVFVEDQAVVETVFFLTSPMMALLRRFPLMLFFDRLPGLQGTFDLATVLCVDDRGRGREVACCLTRQTSPGLLRFTLTSLVQSVPEIKGRVRCVTVGPEVGTQLEAVRELLPGARVQICRVQVLETLFSKAQELGGAGEDPGLWPLLCRLAGAASAAAYMEALAELRATCPAAFVDYFERSWAPRRAMWVRLWAFETARNVDACALVRGHRQRLLRGLSPSPTVAQCIRDLVALQRGHGEGEGPAGDESPGPGLENGGRWGSQWGDRGGRGARAGEGARSRGASREESRGTGPSGGRVSGTETCSWWTEGRRRRSWETGGGSCGREAATWESAGRGAGSRGSAETGGCPCGRGACRWRAGGERRLPLGDRGDRGFRLWERGVQLGDREASRTQLGDGDVQPVAGGERTEWAAGGVPPDGRGDRASRSWDGGQSVQLGDGEEPGAALGELQGRGRAGGVAEEQQGARKRPRSSPEEEDWELLSRFRAVCGPELAGLVAEELTFARQHGVRGFRWTGSGYTLQDGTSDFLLDAALTRCSCSIHAARHLPCRHLFAARLVVGAALFHMDLLRDSWGGAPEP
ncbi:LOW QUALITY PROTEIN: uncharacterized protein ZSWIM9 [Sminthopsis crassicaudata]|uniref:LOW QUALITY PROTEIN: uncharacterized protein ZSWIM9 n=1 Tax=Sminthopsis crassicaudata TaxID=9301 RepID=UPI003D689545